VYKRALNVEYSLRMKASRAFISDVNKKYPCMPFPLRKLVAGGSTSKFGLVECMNHQMLHPYPVLWEKEGETVVHLKGTVLLMPNGSDRVTTAPLQAHKSDKVIEVRTTTSGTAQHAAAVKGCTALGVRGRPLVGRAVRHVWCERSGRVGVCGARLSAARAGCVRDGRAWRPWRLPGCRARPDGAICGVQDPEVKALLAQSIKTKKKSAKKKKAGDLPAPSAEA
jgi:hypothetical protein